jgi:hypothetical protein
LVVFPGREAIIWKNEAIICRRMPFTAGGERQYQATLGRRKTRGNGFQVMAGGWPGTGGLQSPYTGGSRSTSKKPDGFFSSSRSDDLPEIGETGWFLLLLQI